MAALRSPLARSWPVTTRFGDPNAVTRAPHTGVDFGAPFGTPVLAAAAGVARRWWNAGGGNMVGIIHDDGTETRYAHLALALVGGGVRVAAGQQIGTVGSTGLLVTGAHLHFEYLVGGRFVDPLPALAGVAVPGGTSPSSIGSPIPKGASSRVPLIPKGEAGCTSEAGCCPPGYHRVGGVLGTGLGLFGPDAGVYCEPDDMDPIGAAISSVVTGTILPVGVNLLVVGASVLLIWRGVVTILRP